MQLTTTDQRWLAQLLCCPPGAHFTMQSLPLFRYYADRPDLQTRLQSGFEDWIEHSGRKYVVKTYEDYARIN